MVVHLSSSPYKGWTHWQPWLESPLAEQVKLFSVFLRGWSLKKEKKRKRTMGRSKGGTGRWLLHISAGSHTCEPVCKGQSDSFLPVSSFSAVISLECDVCKHATLSSRMTRAKWSLREGWRCFLNALSSCYAGSAGFSSLFGRSYDGP